MNRRLEYGEGLRSGVRLSTAFAVVLVSLSTTVSSASAETSSPGCSKSVCISFPIFSHFARPYAFLGIVVGLRRAWRYILNKCLGGRSHSCRGRGGI